MAQRTLDKQPVLSPDAIPYWFAFGELSTERSTGMSLGPIPFRAMLAYAEYYELSRMQTDLLLKYVSAIDRRYLKLMSERNAKAGDK